MPVTPLALNSAWIPPVIVFTIAARRFCIVCEVERNSGAANAVHGEFVLRSMIELGGLEQRLGRDAAGVQARAAKRVAAIAVLPCIDAGDT